MLWTSRNLRCGSAIAALVLAGVPGLGPATVAGQQSEGSVWAAIGGGALGAYSGAVLGGVGGFVPCNQTYAGAQCLRIAVGVGGASGLTAGIVAGGADREAVEGAAIGAGFGLVGGSLVALLVKPHAEGFGVEDVLTVGLAGAAVGSSLPGSAIGLGVGAATGLVFWQLIPGAGPADAAGVALAGMALGGLATWAARAVHAERDSDGPPLTVPIGVAVRFD